MQGSNSKREMFDIKVVRKLLKRSYNVTMSFRLNISDAMYILQGKSMNIKWSRMSQMAIIYFNRISRELQDEFIARNMKSTE